MSRKKEKLTKRQVLCRDLPYYFFIWLIRKNLLEKFVSNCINHISTWELGVNYKDFLKSLHYNPSRSIFLVSFAFAWYKTREGENFWKRIHSEWRIHYESSTCDYEEKIINS